MQSAKIKLTGITALFILSLVTGCKENSEGDTGVTHDMHGPTGVDETIVRLDRHKIYHTGLRIDTVRKKSLSIPLTLPGRITFNEKKRAHITARVGGRIDTIHGYVNDYFEPGQKLLALYSQEYLAMQFEFLQALQRWERSREAGDSDATANSIFESARRKLLVIGVSEDKIYRLERTRTPETHFSVRTPFSGTILASSVRVGQFVETGDDLYDIADLSTLWILADVYEKDLPLIRSGMHANIVLTAYPDEFAGEVATVYSVVDEKTRTVKIRLEVKNQEGKLKPEMFCTVDIQTALGTETVKIPESAVLGETERHFVFIALNDTTFQKRDIRTGIETRELVEVLDGLLEGERIVVKGGFFLKSELAKETFGEDH